MSKKYVLNLQSILNGEEREDFLKSKEDIIRKNMYKVKNIIVHNYVEKNKKTNESIFTEKSILGAIIKMSGQYFSNTTSIDILTNKGEIVSVNAIHVVDIKTTRSVDREVREKIEIIANIEKERKDKMQNLSNIISKAKEEERFLLKKIDQGIKEIQETFQKNTDTIPSFKLSENIKNLFLNDVKNLEDNYDYNNIYNKSNCTIIYIAAKTVKYPQESDFPGVVYREYDGSLNYFDNVDNLLKEQIKSAFNQKNKPISYDNIASFNGYENELIKINIEDDIDTINKEAAIGVLIRVDYKKDSYNNKETENIISVIKKIIPYT